MIDWSQVKHFTNGELACRCGCEQNLIQEELVLTLDQLRSDFGRPLVVTSGYRCPEHNARVSSTGRAGPHTTGLAVDLGVSGRDAFDLLKLAFRMPFTGIGIAQKGGSRFIHLDLIQGDKRPAIWSY